ncbi:MAG: hypothetical protein A2X46_16150 [Lentisphaerae bacterium GWF2_57_35]|nr:MAG: hypothetical protein A2X46_16150 [Lentisphaerae bacterium GWF2_57_35]
MAYYITAHGYGHGVRSCDVIAALNRLHPHIQVVLVSDLPVEFLKSRLNGAHNSYRQGSFDVGMVQRDSIRVDVAATLSRITDLYRHKKRLLEEERAFLKAEKIDLVVSDVPAIPIEAAHAAGLPAIAEANLSWDWIYEPFAENDPRWRPVVEQFQRGYALTRLLLKPPFSGPMSAFPTVKDIPLMASPGRSRRADLMALTGCRPDRKWILLSFTTLDWDEPTLRRVEQLDGYEFFTVRPLEWNRANIHAVDRQRIPFSDVLASVDAVVTKPGFGILSECVVNRKPIVYADRADFIEYPVLVEAIERYCKNVHIPSEQLYRGELAPALRAIETRPEPVETLAAGGAEIAAEAMADFLS